MTGVHTRPFVLNANVEMVSVGDLPATLRDRLSGDETDCIVSEVASRLNSHRISEPAAAFLGLFRRPRRVVDAVLEYSTEHGFAPEEVLTDVFPLVKTMVANGILADPSVAERPQEHAFEPGDVFAGLEIVSCATDVGDTEIYRARRGEDEVALKYVRADAPEFVRDALAREGSVLAHLGRRAAGCAPRLLDGDLDAAAPFLVMDWVEGETLDRLARTSSPARADRARLAVELASVYARLHASGTLHGDVHPKNVLIDVASSRISLVDLGGARTAALGESGHRIAYVPHYEPEAASAALAGDRVPEPTAKGEQYAVAILVYLLLTGRPYLVLSLETDTLLEQITSEPPRRFADFGWSWDEVEAVVRTALQKDPELRFPTTKAFADALRSAVETTSPREASVVPKPARSTPRISALAVEVNGFRHEYGLRSSLMRSGLDAGPTASVFHGAAGISYALLRLAVLDDDGATAAAADVWWERAQRDRTSRRGFDGPRIGLGFDETAPMSFFHRETGIDLLGASVKLALGQDEEAAGCVDRYRAAASAYAESTRPTRDLDPRTDVTNSGTSLLLGSSLIPRSAAASDVARDDLSRIEERLARAIARDLAADDPLARDGSFLGFAHGLAGVLFALCRSSGASDELRRVVLEHLDMLLERATDDGRIVCWPLAAGGSQRPPWTGWCHGSAGHLLLWCEAARRFDQPRFLEVAERLGTHIWMRRGGSGPSLCCGLAGEAISLLRLGEAVESRAWLERGRALAEQAVRWRGPFRNRHGLFQGRPGIAVAAMEALFVPDDPVWPFCDGVA